MENFNIFKAERKTVEFCPGVEVDGYLLPDEEFRVGKLSIAKALGYGKDWTRRTLKKAENPSRIVRG